MSEGGGPKVIQWPGPSWGPMQLTHPMLSLTRCSCRCVARDDSCPFAFGRIVV